MRTAAKDGAQPTPTRHGRVKEDWDDDARIGGGDAVVFEGVP